MDEDSLEKTVEQSVKLFKSGYYCAESVLLAIAEEKGIQSELIPGIATGFCSGTARMCGPCGAVSGAILSINLMTGRNDPKGSVEKNYTLVRTFLNAFQDKFGSTNCRELIGCDLGTKEGQAYFKAHDLKKDCFAYTREATRIALMILT
jgi:C_GCAxxG_C_C family probable redox protein